VEDVEAQRYLCRTHAGERTFAYATYTTSGRVVQTDVPTAAHWKDVLRDSRATSIRGFSKPPKTA
jgi:hypothetical protein